MADEISLGPWTISAEREGDGALRVEIRLDGETRTTLVLPAEDGGSGAGPHKREDMDF